jgi:hypothetical protein
VQSKNGGAEKLKYSITMLYNCFDHLTTVDFGGENNGAKTFALWPLGGGVFDEK